MDKSTNKRMKLEIYCLVSKISPIIILFYTIAYCNLADFLQMPSLQFPSMAHKQKGKKKQTIALRVIKCSGKGEGTTCRWRRGAQRSSEGAAVWPGAGCRVRLRAAWRGAPPCGMERGGEISSVRHATSSRVVERGSSRPGAGRLAWLRKAWRGPPSTVV
jgi:hypothetical protein